MEPWQVAYILGVDEPPEPDTVDFGAAGRRTLTEADKRRLEKFGQPIEEGTDITERVMRDMGIRTR